MHKTTMDTFEQQLFSAFTVPYADDRFITKLASDLNRAPKLFLQHDSIPQRFTPLALKFGLAFALFVCITILLAGPGKVLAELHSWFLPEFGKTKDLSSITMLNKSEQVEENGYILRINRAYSTPEKVFLNIDLINPEGVPIQDTAPFYESPYLLLEDSSRHYFTWAGHTAYKDEHRLEIDIEFPPLPTDYSDTVLLVVPEWIAALAPDRPTDMQLGITFSPSVPSMAVPNASFDLPETLQIGEISMTIKAAYTLEDAFYFLIEFNTPGPEFTIQPFWVTTATAIDEEGNGYPLQPTNCQQCTPNEALLRAERLSRTPKELTITIPHLLMSYQPPYSPWQEGFIPGFTLNLDPSLEPGYIWNLNQWEQVGPYSIHILNAHLTKKEAQTYEFEVEVAGDPLIRSLSYCAWSNQSEGSFCEASGESNPMIPVDPNKNLVSTSGFSGLQDSNLIFYLHGMQIEYQVDSKFLISMNAMP